MSTLLPVDDPELAPELVRYAVERADDRCITLVAISSTNPGRYAEGGGYACDQLLERQHETAETIFADAFELLSADDCTVETKVLTGRPVREIITLAEETDATNIVVNEGFRTGLSRLLSRSTAEQLVRQAPVPVTIV